MQTAFIRDISDPSQHQEAAQSLLEFAGRRRVFLFEAPMGAGKTTFIKAMCRALGTGSDMSSPTFAIVNEYESAQGPVYHFDLYRLKDEDELRGLGFEEYLDSGNYCFIEWPLLAGGFVDEAVYVTIMVEGDRRILSAHLQG